MPRSVPVTFRPLTQWPKHRAPTPVDERVHAQFKRAGTWTPNATGGNNYSGPRPISLSRTLEDLDRELFHIDADDVVVQVDIESERNIRQDGGIRADARMRSPAVVLSFTRNRVPYVFATDRFRRWEDNLRAIVLGLEGLRRLERYHIAQAGDQYRGWQALPATTTAPMGVATAADAIAKRAGDPYTGKNVLADHLSAKHAVRRAAARAHPDGGGTTEEFQLVQEAKRVLEAHFGGSL
jgi:hypothetical protein